MYKIHQRQDPSSWINIPVLETLIVFIHSPHGLFELIRGTGGLLFAHLRTTGGTGQQLVFVKYIGFQAHPSVWLFGQQETDGQSQNIGNVLQVFRLSCWTKLRLFLLLFSSLCLFIFYCFFFFVYLLRSLMVFSIKMIRCFAMIILRLWFLFTFNLNLFI